MNRRSSNKETPLFINGVFWELLQDVGQESHHVSFIGYETLICKRIGFLLNGHVCSLFSGIMPNKIFRKKYEQA